MTLFLPHLLSPPLRNPKVVHNNLTILNLRTLRLVSSNPLVLHSLNEVLLVEVGEEVLVVEELGAVLDGNAVGFILVGRFEGEDSGKVSMRSEATN